MDKTTIDSKKTAIDSKKTADRRKKPTTAGPLNKPELTEDELKAASGGFVWGPGRIVPTRP
jgi:hypothetical protein